MKSPWAIPDDPRIAGHRPEPEAGKYDSAARRKGVRRGRERGCWIFVPAVELAKTGFDPRGEVPRYRVWANDRGRVVVQLYRGDR